RVGGRQTGESGRKRGILRDHLLEYAETPGYSGRSRPHFEGACAQIEVVCFDASLVAPAAPSQLHAQAVDDASRNLILDNEDVGEFPVIPARPNRKIIAHAHELGVNSQLAAGAQYGTFQDVIRCKLPAGLTDIAWLAFKYEGRRLGARGKPIDDREIANDFAGQTVGKVAAGGILAQVNEGQSSDRNWRASVVAPPPRGSGQDNH